MAWTDWPADHGVSKRREYKWIRQLWEALRERYWCTGPASASDDTPPVYIGTIWPRTNTRWTEGTITSLVDNEDGTWTLTDSNLAAAPGTDDGRYWNGVARTAPFHEDPYWVGYANPDEPQLPTNYDLIIQLTNGEEEWYRDQAPWAIVRGDLDASTSQTLTFEANVANYVTAGAIPADPETSLVGAKYYLIATGGMWWADKSFAFGRYPDWPNHNELWRGTVDVGSVVKANGTDAIIFEQTNKVRPDPYNEPDPQPNAWATDVWGGMEVLVYDEDGDLRRLTVTSNTSAAITLGAGTGPFGDEVELSITGSTDPGDDETLTFTWSGTAYQITSPADYTGTLSPGETGWVAFTGLVTHATTTATGTLAGDNSGGVPVVTGWTGGGVWAGTSAAFEPLAAEPLALTGAYTIVPVGSRGWPERKPWRTSWWYGGAQETVQTHDPSLDPALSAGPIYPRTLAFADDVVSWEELEPGAIGVVCGDPGTIVNAAALDEDLWSALVNQCDLPDHNYSPHFFKSLRALQREIERLLDSGSGGSFVRPVDYTAAKEIPTYSTAQCFADCSINNGTASVASEIDGSNTIYYFTVATAYKGWPVFWEATKDGLREGAGYTASDATTGKVILATVDTAGGDHSFASASIVYSAGWTRWHRLAFTHMYERGAFIPDVDLSGEVGDAVYPPAVEDFEEDGCFGVGTWYWRGVSTGYKTYDAYGYAQDASNDFVADKAARYMGDAWLDPGTGDTRKSDDDTADLIYWDRFYEGQHPKTTQLALRSARTGTVTAATASSATDADTDWYSSQWYSPDGVMRTETGTATGGSSTTLVTTESLTDTEDAAHCWWQADRFSGDLFDGKPYLAFILEIDKVDGAVTTTYRVPITDVTDNTAGNAPTLHFAAVDGLTVASGDVWRIVEPATTLHRWRGKRVKFTRSNGSTFEVEITHNDATTLFFAEQTDEENVPQADWGYEIIEHETGGVWKFQTTEPTTEQKLLKWQKIGTNKYWVQPTGTDTRATASATWHGPTHQNMCENLAHLHPKKFGRMGKGDSIGLHIFDELYKMLNRLVWTKTTASWSSRADPAVAELNEKTSASMPGPGYPGWSSASFDALKAEADTAWTTATPTEANGPPPTAIASVDLSDGTVNPLATLLRRYAYAVVGGIPNLIAHKTKLWSTADEVETRFDVECSDVLGETSGVIGTFDANGDGSAYGVYGLLTTSAPNKDDEERILVGPTSLSPKPNWPAFVENECDPVNFVSQVSFARGYGIDLTEAVIQWNVEGGLRYVDWQAE